MGTFNFGEASVTAWCAVYPEFAQDLRDAINFCNSKPDIALFKLRRVLERIVKRAYVHFTAQPLPENSKLSELLTDSDFAVHVPHSIRNAMHSVRESGNRAVHDLGVTASDVAREFQSMDRILRWSASTLPGSRPLPSYAVGATTSSSASLSRLKSRVLPMSSMTPAAVGVSVVLILIALVWLYLRNLDGMLNEQQSAWVQRQQKSSSRRTSAYNDTPALNNAALSNDAVVLTHPSPQQQSELKSNQTPIGFGASYSRNYPSSWPSPFFREEIKPGDWGTWLEQPNWQQHRAEHDFIWYRAVESGGVGEANEWAIQCQDGQGLIRDITAGHNEQCEVSRLIRIRNDWQHTALVYYFAKSPSPR